MYNLKIHTIELTYPITNSEHNIFFNYFIDSKKRFYKEVDTLKLKESLFLGFIEKGIQIKLYNYPDINIYQLKYIINPSRYYDNDQYLDLSDIDKISSALKSAGEFLKEQYKLLPEPLSCRITRIDLTKNIYVGDNIDYIIKLLNRCYLPEAYRKYMDKQGFPKDNATFTKYKKSKRNKIFELSFYNKQAEMCAHITDGKYYYSPELIKKAEGILRMEMRIYSARLKNMKRTIGFDGTEDFLSMLPRLAHDIVRKNLQKMYMVGGFYKLADIKDRINNSNYHTVTRDLMTEFINNSAIHKSAETSADMFEAKCGKDVLKNILRKFNELGIIPVPIAVKKKLNEWNFIDC